jgi:ribonuclease III
VSAALHWAGAALDHHFSNESLLTAALTHSSASGTTYERLEFLGDRVLGLVIAEWLVAQYPQESEGVLNRRLSELVRRESCADVARRIDVLPHVKLERAARAAGVQNSDNVLGDICEALIAALYLDGGMAAAKHFIRKEWQALLENKATVIKDAKSALQEWAQGRGLPLPSYALVGQSGPDHAPVFDVEVRVEGYTPEVASAPSKQDAQKRAATALLARLEHMI